ncbi:MAG: PIN domain-containing protein [Ginsengibacter sp.]
MEILSITVNHIEKLLKLPDFHLDPFDRTIISQALFEELLIVTRDQSFIRYTSNILLK